MKQNVLHKGDQASNIHVSQEGPARVSQISDERLAAAPKPVPSGAALNSSEKEPKTYLYLGYGSNLAASTFKGSRGIKPLSAVNVLCPELKLTFDLPGMPYSEPCFANTALRDPEEDTEAASQKSELTWTKGLVGVVYEVTPADYAHIIATEGGGASYQDVLVTCYPLEPGVHDVPDMHDLPRDKAFVAHTLFAPRKRATPPDNKNSGTAASSFTKLHEHIAQPSPRYLGLLRTGANEHKLPTTYQAYLNSLQPYVKTQKRQYVGEFIILLTFGPFLLLLFALMRRYSEGKGNNGEGQAPAWLKWLATALFESVWVFYRNVLHPIFGEGEWTVDAGDENQSADLEKCWIKLRTGDSK
jgi:hypothetical protein